MMIWASLCRRNDCREKFFPNLKQDGPLPPTHTHTRVLCSLRVSCSLILTHHV